MDEFLHDIIHVLGDMKMAVERAMKQLENLATRKAEEDAEKEKNDENRPV